MKSKDLSAIKSKLQNMRAHLLGGIEKNLKTSKDEVTPSPKEVVGDSPCKVRGVDESTK